MNLHDLAELFAPPTPDPELSDIAGKSAEPTGFQDQFTPKQWDALQRHPEILDGWKLAYQFGLERSAGIAPDHYTAVTVCDGCGAVPIWHGAPASVRGCPWCGNRLAGLPIPKPMHRLAIEGGGGGPVALPGHVQDGSPRKEVMS